MLRVMPDDPPSPWAPLPPLRRRAVRRRGSSIIAPLVIGSSLAALAAHCTQTPVAVIKAYRGSHLHDAKLPTPKLRGSVDSTSLRPTILGAPEVAPEKRLLDVQLVELRADTAPWRVVKILVPLTPQVARWWSGAAAGDFSAHVVPALTGSPQVHIQISTAQTFEVNGVQVHGIHAVVDLPDDAMLESCHVGSTRVTAAFEPLAELGPIRALLVDCPMKPKVSNLLWLGERGPLSGFLARLLFRLFLMPGIFLLMPGILSYPSRPWQLLAGACLTIASIVCLSCLTTVLIIVAQKHCVHYARRWRRIWHLRSLTRRAALVDTVFGAGGPCCICLGEPSATEPVIALLPCRHALHRECYVNWVRADSYPSRDLICPLCRHRAEAIGKLDDLQYRVRDV